MINPSGKSGNKKNYSTREAEVLERTALIQKDQVLLYTVSY
jgi:hypothetical protein